MTTQSKLYFAISFLFLVIILSLLFSCGNSANGKKVNDNKTDTTAILGKYVSPSGEDVFIGELIKYTFTTVTPDSNDISKNNIKKDSAYAVPAFTYIKDSITGKVMLDSTGKAIKTVRYWFIPKNTVWDSGIEIDSAIHNRLRKLVRKAANDPDSLFIKQGQ